MNTPPTDNIVRKKIYLAALLHDIGKFWQRASGLYKNDGDNLSNTTRNLIGFICPETSTKKFGYYHVLWTSEFFEKYKQKFPEELRATASSQRNDNNTANLAAYHHYPSTKLQAIITLADHWSSGSDRLNEENMEDSSSAGFKETPLRHIFDMIDAAFGSNEKPRYAEHNHYVPFNSLSLEKEKIFPKQKNLNVNQHTYKSLWDSFVKDFQAIADGSEPEAFIETLYYVLKKHTWCIPSATNEQPVITPLFEHLKTTAAFASCLYDYYEENNNAFKFESSNGKTKATVREGHYPVLMVGGDISGIQNFIYNIHSNKAAKSLKGRSFYLYLLTDAIIRRILFHKDIDLNWANVLYASGGKFYLLLPNTEKVKDALKCIAKDIEEELFNKHNMRIAYLWACLPFSVKTRRENNAWETYMCTEDGNKLRTGELWRKLAEILQTKKEQKFKAFLKKSEQWKTLFTPKGMGGETRVDAITGDELEENQWKPLSQEEDLYTSSYNFNLIKLGSVLKDVDYILIYKKEEKKDYISNRAKAHIEIAGIHYYLFDQKELKDDNAKFGNISSVDYAHVIKINDTKFLVPFKGKNASYGFWFYGGNKQAEIRKAQYDKEWCEKQNRDPENEEDREKTFSELTYLIDRFPCVPDEKYLNEVPHSYLGILRMDVDNLGKIFQKGLSNTTGTFAIYSALSFALDLFFSGYLNIMREKYKDYVNILYSGGDDLFILGRWKEVLDMAIDIRKDFRAYTGRDDITLSGGMVIVRPKFPVSRAAGLAGEAEANAKKHVSSSHNNQVKNAFSVFGEVLEWEKWIVFKSPSRNDESMWRLDKWLEVYGIQNEKYQQEEVQLGLSVLHKLQSYYDFIKWQEKMQEYHPGFKKSKKYVWHAVYYLTRQLETLSKPDKQTGIRRPKKDKKAGYDFVKQLQAELLNEAKYKDAAILSRWTELILKDEKKKENAKKNYIITV